MINRNYLKIIFFCKPHKIISSGHFSIMLLLFQWLQRLVHIHKFLLNLMLQCILFYQELHLLMLLTEINVLAFKIFRFFLWIKNILYCSYLSPTEIPVVVPSSQIYRNSKCSSMTISIICRIKFNSNSSALSFVIGTHIRSSCLF